MFYQTISLFGAAMILGAYFALQRGQLNREDRLFNALNLIGSGLLTWVAVASGQIGFVLLEGAWALLSLPGTIRRRAAN